MSRNREKSLKYRKTSKNFKKLGENRQNYRKTVKNVKKPGENRQKYRKIVKKCRKTGKTSSKISKNVKKTIFSIVFRNFWQFFRVLLKFLAVFGYFFFPTFSDF